MQCGITSLQGKSLLTQLECEHIATQGGFVCVCAKLCARDITVSSLPISNAVPLEAETTQGSAMLAEKLLL